MPTLDANWHPWKIKDGNGNVLARFSNFACAARTVVAKGYAPDDDTPLFLFVWSPDDSEYWDRADCRSMLHNGKRLGV